MPPGLIVGPNQCVHFYAFLRQEHQPAQHPEKPDTFGLMTVDIFFCQKCLQYRGNPIALNELPPDAQEQIRQQIAGGNAAVVQPAEGETPPQPPPFDPANAPPEPIPLFPESEG